MTAQLRDDAPGDGADAFEWCRRCIRCMRLRDPDGRGAKSAIPPDRRRMVLCERCGNKRCPHATDHRYVCTASNASGQVGSIYGTPGRFGEIPEWLPVSAHNASLAPQLGSVGASDGLGGALAHVPRMDGAAQHENSPDGQENVVG